MPELPTPRPMPAARPPRAVPGERPVRAKPDANPLRLLVGLAGIASASAIASAMLPSVTPAPATVADIAALTDATTPGPSVIHVTRVVMLKPGQTAPPQASVVVPPTPTPRVKVVTTTRQSGTVR